jgi:hypothetical protein
MQTFWSAEQNIVCLPYLSVCATSPTHLTVIDLAKCDFPLNFKRDFLHCDVGLRPPLCPECFAGSNLSMEGVHQYLIFALAGIVKQVPCVSNGV